MIQVWMGESGLWIRGHAGAGPPGEDLVCAAASMLVQTLARTVLRLEAQGETAAVRIRIRPGSAAIRCRNTAPARAAFRVIRDGFSLLCAAHPACVELRCLAEQAQKGEDHHGRKEGTAAPALQ